MSSNWLKIRRLHEIDRIHKLGFRRPQIPRFIPLGSNHWRMLFSVRNKDNRAEILSVDIALLNETDFRVDEDSIQPFLERLEKSRFDKDSCFTGDYTTIRGKPFLFYTAGTDIQEPPFFEGCIAYVELGDDIQLVPQSRGRIALDIDVADPYALMAPCIHSNGSRYLVWYASTQYLPKEFPTTLEHRYHIRCAVSGDGCNWSKFPKPAIDFNDSAEGGITCPWVMESNGFYEMWYNTRGRFSKKHPELRRYRIGYATSGDGIDWTRRDNEHLFMKSGKESNWDHEMQCYATVLKTERGRQFMFYCGNDYGDGGIGYAARTQDAT